MSDPTTEAERRSGPPWRFLVNMLVVGAIAFLAGGFGYFVASLENRDPAVLPRGEAAVALTGGAERISDALELLGESKVKRLLITGLNQATTGAEIARLTPRFQNWMQCCVDLGYEALNTRGNALETRDWIRKRGLNGPIVVVTSTYHMPRALLELRHVAPDMAFIPYNVVTERQRSGDWWRSARGVRLLVVEYVKFLAAILRTGIAPTPPV